MVNLILGIANVILGIIAMLILCLTKDSIYGFIGLYCLIIGLDLIKK